MHRRLLAGAALFTLLFAGLGCPIVGSNMTWTISDGCPDGLGIEVRFFDKTNNLVWPPSQSNVYITGSGGSVQQTLACQAGAQICYGARPRSQASTNFWGVGINGTEGCAACCTNCFGGATSRNLVCN